MNYIMLLVVAHTIYSIQTTANLQLCMYSILQLSIPK